MAKKIIETKKIDPGFDPHLLFTWSRKRIVITVAVCVLLSVAGVAGFLLAQEYRKPANADQVIANKPAPPDWTDYANDYWGFQFKYPGSWSAARGSFADGEYYFSSQPINFISELNAGEALVIVKAYNNWQHLSFEAWLQQQQDTYFPRGDITLKPASVDKLPAKKITLKFRWPKDNVGYWEGYVVSRSDATKYLFLLATDSPQTADRFRNQFTQMINSLSLLPVKAK
jgi:hypothetical protein